MTSRNLADFYDPAVDAEDMGRPTRAEAERDRREGGMTVRDCGDCFCGTCLACALAGRRGL
jgi:hypothetical protein